MHAWIADPRTRRIAGAAAILVAALLILLAAFPWGLLRGPVEQRLSDRIGAPVTIGAIERQDAFSFTPTLAIHDIRIPQPGWAGSGDLARIDTLQLRMSAWGALFGHPRPDQIAITGMHLALVRDTRGRENWTELAGRGGAGVPNVARLAITDGHVRYDDAVRDRHLTATLAASTGGVRLAGQGTIAGHEVSLRAAAPAIVDRSRWPFALRIDGDALTLHANGVMAHPLDTRHMTLDVTTRADDLKLVDAVIEAGLFGTQPVALASHVTRDGQRWTLSDLKGTIGRSDVAGHLAINKAADGRATITGAVSSNQLAFEDFASDAGAAAAIAKERVQGLRLVPDTRINLAKLGDTDGRIDVRVKHIVSRRRPSSLAWMHGTVTLDHRLLTVKPLALGLTRGTIGGSVIVDQRDGRAVPTLRLSLDLRNSTLGTIAGGDGTVDARLMGRARITGRGSTIREAVGNGDGRIGVVARNGVLPARIASLLGFDVARGLTTGDDARAALRCAVVALDLADGTARLAPMVIDTSRARSTGTGTIRFPDERLAIRITGTPKQQSVLRLPGALIASGTIRAPKVAAEEGTRSFGNVLKAIGQSITGNQAPRASDADCDALAARALGR